MGFFLLIIKIWVPILVHPKAVTDLKTACIIPCQRFKSQNLHVVCCFHFAIFQSFSQALADIFANDSLSLPNVSAIGS